MIKATKIYFILIYILTISFVSSLDNNKPSEKEKKILNIVFGSLLIAVGPLFLLLGYRAYKVTLSISGFIVVSTIIYFTLITYIEIKWWIILLIALLSGLVVGLFIFFLWIVGVFIIGFSFGSVIGIIALSTPLGAILSSHLYARILIVIIPGVIIGIISLIFQRMFTIISSSVLGSFFIASGIGIIWNVGTNFGGIVACLFSHYKCDVSVTYNWPYFVLLSSILVLSIIAILLQNFIICKKYYHDVSQKSYVTIN